MEKLSVAIITFNEEENIERCIQSVASFADEILVVDSFSTDRTVELAESLGAKVLQNRFDGFIEQRGFCIKNAKYDFILALDCDECPDETLKASIRKIKINPSASTDTSRKIFLLNRLSAIGDQFLYHGNWHPDWKLRLFFRESVIMSGNPPHDKIDSKPGIKIEKLKGKLLHYSDRTKADRTRAIEKHSTVAANFRFSEKRKSNALKIFIKPIFRFLSGFIFKRGFLDGALGFFVAKSEARYVFLREQKLSHLWKNKT